jgi:hypothetical protein
MRAKKTSTNQRIGQKKLPEGWLLSTSGSAPRHEAVDSSLTRCAEAKFRRDGTDYNLALNHCQSMESNQ